MHRESDKYANLLIYWTNHQVVYSVLATIPQGVLTIPATNIAVERLFFDIYKLGKVNRWLFITRNVSTLDESNKWKNSQEDDDCSISVDDHDNTVSENDET